MLRRLAMFDFLTAKRDLGLRHTAIAQIGLLDFRAFRIHHHRTRAEAVAAAVVEVLIAQYAHVFELSVESEAVIETGAIAERAAQGIGVGVFENRLLAVVDIFKAIAQVQVRLAAAERAP